jgi:hypothetical protein
MAHRGSFPLLPLLGGLVAQPAEQAALWAALPVARRPEQGCPALVAKATGCNPQEFLSRLGWRWAQQLRARAGRPDTVKRIASALAGPARAAGRPVPALRTIEGWLAGQPPLAAHLALAELAWPGTAAAVLGPGGGAAVSADLAPIAAELRCLLDRLAEAA